MMRLIARMSGTKRMSDVTPLPGCTVPVLDVCPDTVAAAERFAEMVRSGEVVGFALAAEHHDRCTSAIVSGSFNHFGLIGRFEVLKVELALEISRDE